MKTETNLPPLFLLKRAKKRERSKKREKRGPLEEIGKKFVSVSGAASRWLNRNSGRIHTNTKGVDMKKLEVMGGVLPAKGRPIEYRYTTMAAARRLVDEIRNSTRKYHFRVEEESVWRLLHNSEHPDYWSRVFGMPGIWYDGYYTKLSPDLLLEAVKSAEYAEERVWTARALGTRTVFRWDPKN